MENFAQAFLHVYINNFTKISLTVQTYCRCVQQVFRIRIRIDLALLVRICIRNADPDPNT
jgi:hypothetical protein